MDIVFFSIILVVVFALVFDFINGFHDTANAVATVVSTGVLPMRTAVLGAALLNFVGALHGTAVASTIGKGVIVPEAVTQIVVLSALSGAIFWNLFTWYFGIPSSSSHALVGGIVGAGYASAGAAAIQKTGLEKIVITLVLSPLVGMLVAFLLMILVLWLCRKSRPSKISRRFKRLQLLSAGFMAYSHGSNDAQKTMGIITMSLVAYGAVVANGHEFPVPLWVMISSALAMGLGTAAGGVRIIKTLGTKIIDLKPIHGFVAETTAAMTILGASYMGQPVSTTHVISGAILGVGSSQRVSAVRWGVTVRILWAWILTIPISALTAALAYGVLSFVLA